MLASPSKFKKVEWGSLNAKQKQKYRGMFETQKSRNKTSSGDIGLNIRTLVRPKVGQDQVKIFGRKFEWFYTLTYQFSIYSAYSLHGFQYNNFR